MRRSHRRKGVAVTELAFVLPFIVLFAFVPLELSKMIHLRQSLSVSAYEAVKIATRKQGTYAVAQIQFDQIILDRGIKGATIDFSVTEANLGPGDRLTVTCEAPFSQNALFGLWYLDKSPAVSVTMIKE